ncbi:MAG: pyrimidine-nucleoside phosphorylase [Lachnospiraceae bacterium]|nr:pyrimidine-nucleoside phosphorylase [Lachnospiraceae bacterium]
MRMVDIIEKKKNGQELADEEIREMITALISGDLPDYQLSAFLMAVVFQGMNERETLTLTKAMRDSGDTMDLSKIHGIKVDKHSSGGVGDKTTLVVAPLVAALGVPVAKMSGRGLGHTGGTIDKLESIPGFQVNISEEDFIHQVNRIGFALASQTSNLAPADKKIYAMRDVTATVQQRSLIASSIMSKKLASGSDAIVLDVKCGDGAFMKDVSEARSLAETMVKIGNGAGKETVALITNMAEPLGTYVGNNLEVIEAIEALKGNGEPGFMEVVYALGAQMLLVGKIVSSKEEAYKKMKEAIEDGSAFLKFKEFVSSQGGDVSYIDDPSKFPKAKLTLEVHSDRKGYVNKIHTEAIGETVMRLGGGRAKKDDVIDMTVGLKIQKKVGDMISEGDTIAVIYGNTKEQLAQAEKEVLMAYEITDKNIDKIPMILDEITQ